MSFAKISILGNLGKDAELKTSERAGKKFAVFSVAVNDWKANEGGEPKEVTTWYQIIFWGDRSENLVQYLKKGREIFVEGSLSVESYKGEHGEPKLFLQVRASDVQLTNGNKDKEKKEEKEEPASEPAAAQTSTSIEQPSVKKSKNTPTRKPEAAA